MTVKGSGPVRPVRARLGLLRIGSTNKRTPAEQEAHRREKLLRDEWCRQEQIKSVKKDDEQVYKSGRHIIIERGDGEDVEVRELKPGEGLGFLKEKNT